MHLKSFSLWFFQFIFAPERCFHLSGAGIDEEGAGWVRDPAPGDSPVRDGQLRNSVSQILSGSNFQQGMFYTSILLYKVMLILHTYSTYPYQNALEHGTYNGRNVSVCKVVFIHDGVMYILWWVTWGTWPVLRSLSAANGCNGHCSDTRLSAYCEPRLCKC